MRAQQIREEKKKGHKWSRVLWIIYICFMVFVGTIAFARLISLLRRIKWRNDLGDEFPSSCGSWAQQKGCTRVVLQSDGCNRAKDIVN